MGIFDDFVGAAGDAWKWAKGAAGSVGGFAGDALGGPDQAPPAPVYGGSQAASDAAVGRYQGMGADAAGRQGVQVGDQGQLQDYAQSQQSRGATSDALGMARQAALGQAPSVAAIQQQQGLNDSIQSQMAMAASARGGAMGQMAAQRNAANVGGQMQQQGVNAAAALRANEMANARGQYGSLATQQRAQDLSSRQGSAQQAQYQANLEDSQRGRNDAAQSGYEGMASGIVSGNQEAQAGNQTLQANVNQQRHEARAKTVGGIINGASAAAGAISSDERGKKGFEPANGLDPSVAALHLKSTRPDWVESQYDAIGAAPKRTMLEDFLDVAHKNHRDSYERAGEAEARRIDELLGKSTSEDPSELEAIKAENGMRSAEAERDAAIAKRGEAAQMSPEQKMGASGMAVAMPDAPSKSAVKAAKTSLKSDYTSPVGKGAPPGPPQYANPVAGFLGGFGSTIASSFDLKDGFEPSAGKAFVNSLGGEGANGAMWAAQSKLGGLASGMGTGPASSDPRSIGDSFQQFKHDTVDTIDKAAKVNRGGTMAALGTLTSDARAKTDMKGGAVLDDLLGAFRDSASTYEYKNPANQPTSEPAPGKRFAGVMAQAVERVPEIGKSIVTDTPGGKVLEGPALESALAAAVGRQQQQIDAMKRRRGAR